MILFQYVYGILQEESEVMKVLVIIPAYNEGKNIEAMITELQRETPDMDYVIINDGSTDKTAEICLKNKYNMVSLPINLGIGGGVQTGYLYARKNHYDIAIQMDGDGQHDPAYIHALIEPIVNGEADVVIGSRFLVKEGFQSSKARRAGIAFLSRLIQLCTRVHVKDATSGFRAVNRKFILEYARQYPIDYPEPEAIVYAALRGAKIKEVPVVMRERENGVSTINFTRSVYYMIKVSIAILVCRLSKRRKKK